MANHLVGFNLFYVLLFATHHALTTATTIRPTSGKQSGANETQAEQLATSPSVTSVHQVWTSSSSGSLEELSPEIISKLRNDVPFLAAYAMRPRLVGASSGQEPGAPAIVGTSDRPQAPDVASETSRVDRVAKLQSDGSLIPKLGDFNEFRVESSSLSKSEHHHNRKTTLKRADKSGQNTRRASNSLRQANKRRNKRKRPHLERESARRSSARTRRKSAKYQEATEAGDVKGGHTQAGKRPFYSKGSEPADDGAVNSLDRTRPDSAEDTEEAELPEASPRRVGDGDVEEDGDTVTVVPKSDGVDDDPAIPDENEAEPEDNGTPQERPTGETDAAIDDRDLRDNQGPSKGSTEQGGRKEEEAATTGEAGESLAGGGGVGATIGGGRSGSGSRDGDGRGDASGDGHDGKAAGSDGRRSLETDDEQRDSAGDKQPKRDQESGVEFANDDADRESANGARGSGGDSTFGDRKSAGASGGDDSSSEMKDDDDDVDYRDELDTAKGGGGGERKSSGHRCEDGSYDHGHDHGHQHGHHHGIEWLRGAVPGEPDRDYPILSRVNATNFNCRDHKHPGYYADVESRCQIFHICQADGRQDSFLCPNGTIFSQRSTVCVWWNSFDCEDAPNYYHLNELLYKRAARRQDEASQSESGSSEHSAPSGGRRLRPKQDITPRDYDDDESSGIDHLIESMKRKKEASADEDAENRAPMESPAGPQPSGNERRGMKRRTQAQADDEDEATIQRKSTQIDESDFKENASAARLKSGTSASTSRRRRRRASVRQAPPKLKSRRVSRTSRRRKLRVHVSKPKRRA